MKLPTLLTGLLAAPTVLAASLQQVTSFGSNPSGARMFIYVPDNLAPSAPIIVAIHYCTGTAQAYYTGTPYARLADKHGFIVIYPESPYSGSCWDVSSPATLSHDGGANSNSIANMVAYTLSQYSADASRVFVTGTSSGAMMTNVLAATYPNLFKAAAAYAGVPAGCFYTGTVAGWNSTCAQGKEIHSQDVWAQTALKMYPGYTGQRPKMRIYHGNADSTIYPQNFNETVKQWAGVLGYKEGSPKVVKANSPKAPWTEYVYGDNLIGIYGAGITHDIPIQADTDLEFFGITGQSSGPSTTLATSTRATTSVTATKTSSANVTPTPPPAGGCTAKRWDQCGGQGFTGCKVCEAPYTCKFTNDWYSQCL